jgi:hypothetical protein
MTRWPVAMQGLVHAALVCGVLVSAAASRAAGHPRLLVQAEDIPRMRHACGVGAPAADKPAWGRFGWAAADYQALRAHFAAHPGNEVLPGELAAAALLHLINPDDAGDAQRLALINAALQRPLWITTDALEATLALDWCFDDLAPETRRMYLHEARRRAELLEPSDSPLVPRVFRARLAAVALALAIDDADEPSPSYQALRARLIEAARKHFDQVLPVFIAWRTPTPTGPAAGPQEECDTALAVEFARQVLERDTWAGQRDGVGCWLEHYVFGTLDHPALDHNFVRDDGDRAPRLPVPFWRDMLPVTAHLIAHRTQDPAAVLIARRVEQQMRGGAAFALQTPWRWVPIALPIEGYRACDPEQLPLARDLGGSVVFRGGAGADTTAVWIDAAQPFLRRRQHFDAGHFLIYRAGRLALGAADDVVFAAVPGKGGQQHLGRRRAQFDFERYFTATIAHNCVIRWDVLRLMKWYGERYEAVGGQRCIEHSCTDFDSALASQERQTGEKIAYGMHDAEAYLALDLMPAYGPKVFVKYTREFVFVRGRILVVIDRMQLPEARTPPTWVVNVPTRPRADGVDLTNEARVLGSRNDAGVWRYDTAESLAWQECDGRLWMHVAWPRERVLRVVGGPAETLRVPEGPHAGRRYVGGDAGGFERLIIPGEREKPENAWFRLGAPQLLGPLIGKAPHWGRIELEPAHVAAQLMFAVVLCPEGPTMHGRPTVTTAQRDDALVITIESDDARAALTIPTGMPVGGSVRIDDGEPWPLPETVASDPPLATH